MAIKIIAAIADNGVIGKEGVLPWNKLRGDMIHFVETTDGKAVVTGRKNYFSIPDKFRPLKGRENIVLTRHPKILDSEDVTIEENFLNIVLRSKTETIWVIGGSEVYNLFLPFADEMVLTRVHAKPEGDVFFPKWSQERWELVSSLGTHPADARNEHSFTIERYRQRRGFIEMANIRTLEQYRDMKEIYDLGVCPFCTEYFLRWHTKPIYMEGVHWIVTENKYPYLWTKDGGLHLMLVLKTHAEDLHQMPDGSFEELGAILEWASKKFNILGAGFYMRFGECLWTGGTIRHIHAHIGQKKDLNTPAIFYL